EAHLTEATDRLDALLRAAPPGDERSSDLRWLHQWRLDRAPADERPRLLAAWAAAAENELGDPAAALTLYRQVLESEPEDLDALAAVSRLSLARGDVEGALAALQARRAASEGEARNALDVEIAQLLVDLPGRAREALDRVAEVLES